MAIFLKNIQQKHRGHVKKIIIPVPIGYRGYFSGVKRPNSKDGHSVPSSVEVKNNCHFTFIPSHVPVQCRQVTF